MFSNYSESLQDTRAEQAISINGYVDAAINWLSTHPEGNDKDKRLVVCTEWVIGWDQGRSMGDSGPAIASTGYSFGGGAIGGGGPIGGSSEFGGTPNSLASAEPEEPPKPKMTDEEREEAIKRYYYPNTLIP